MQLNKQISLKKYNPYKNTKTLKSEMERFFLNDFVVFSFFSINISANVYSLKFYLGILFTKLKEGKSSEEYIYQNSEKYAYLKTTLTLLFTYF